MTPAGQRFFTCLLNTLSLRGASVGLWVCRDVAIARYAFGPVSLKSQNRVLGRCHPELVEGRVRWGWRCFLDLTRLLLWTDIPRSIAAEAVTLSRQSNQRRARPRKCLFARRPLPCKIKQNPRLQIFVPDYLTNSLTCNGQIFDAFVALPSPVLFYFYPRLLR